LGKYHSASADANTDSDSFSVRHTIPHNAIGAIRVDNAICIAIGDLCISDSEPGRHGLAKSA
jgi:hypothetical protein